MTSAPPPEFSFRTRRHFWQHLKNHKDVTYNVVVIGGGIVGAGFLRELGLQGIPLCFLFEKNDFASGTSGASSKLVHAGIRYLEQAWDAVKRGQFRDAWRNFRFVIDASRERKVLGELAPHLIKPKPIYLVLGEKDKRSVFSVALGVWFYYLIQICQRQFFRPPKIVFRKEALSWTAPEIDALQVKALFSFWDSETDDARLVMENLQAAHELGCYAMNYVEIVNILRVADGFLLTLQNNENNESLIIKTKRLVNATGAYVDDVRKLCDDGNKGGPAWVNRVAGSHVDVYPALTSESYYITAGDGRLVFVLKRNEDGLLYTRIGTTERPLRVGESPAGIKPTPAEIDYLVNLAQEFFPQAQINERTILRTDAGVRPLRHQEAKDAFHISREHEIIEEDGLYHMIGVKLTDFRRVAHELLLKIRWDDLNLRLTDLGRSERISLREKEEPRAYVEQDIVEMVRRTMVLHWRDYVERRRGLGPRVLRKINPEAFKREFDAMKEILEWDEASASREWESI